MEYFTPKFWQMTIGFLVIVSLALMVTFYVSNKGKASANETAGLTTR